MARYFTKTVQFAVNAELHRGNYRPGLNKKSMNKEKCIEVAKKELNLESAPEYQDVSVLNILRQ